MKLKRWSVVCAFLASVSSLAYIPRLAAQASPQPKTPVAVQAAPQADSQQISSPPAVIPPLAVPRLVKFSGVATDENGNPHTGVVGLSFSVYKDQQGGAALWMETQNVELNSLGQYTVLLGSTQSEGLPLDLFSTGDPRWLGVKVEMPGEVEQARVLLVSVPYALKASDADTLGGRPASAYLLAPESTSGTSSFQASSAPATAGTNTASANAKANTSAPPPTTTTNYIPIFTNSTGSLGNSAIYQSSTGNIGIGYTNPLSRLVVGAPSGGGVLNASNLVDQDMQITLTAPGATDKKAFFGSSTDTNLTLGVNSTEMMRITSSGNVGIGYSNPTGARLVVGVPSGGAVMNASNISDQDMFITLTAPGATDKHAYFGPSTNTNLTLGVNSTEMMRITNTGSVGIGTSTPASQLDVEGTNNGLTANYIYATGGLGDDGIDAYSTGYDAVYGENSGYDGGDFYSFGSGNGTTSETYYDATYYTGAAGWNYGTTQEDIGVWGYSASPIGIASYAEGYGSSTEGTLCCAGYYTIGMWADTSGNSGSAAGIGALTTVDNGYSIYSLNNTPYYATSWFENDDDTETTSPVFVTYGGYTGGYCEIDVSGNLTCTGTITPAVPIKGGASKVALYGVEAAENWFEDAGSAQLSNGAAVVHLDATFAETVNTGVEYHVFLTPNGDCKGLYVSQKSTNSFEVHELGGGSSNIAFDYRIMAKRRGYETARLTDVTKQLALKGATRRAPGTRVTTPDDVRKQHQQKMDEHRKVLLARRAALARRVAQK